MPVPVCAYLPVCVSQLGRFLGGLFATRVYEAGGIVLTAGITTGLHTAALCTAVYILRRSQWRSDTFPSGSASTPAVSTKYELVNSCTSPSTQLEGLQPVDTEVSS